MVGPFWSTHLTSEAHLRLQDYLLKWPKTLLVVSHARDFLNTVCTDVLHLHHNKITSYRYFSTHPCCSCLPPSLPKCTKLITSEPLPCKLIRMYVLPWKVKTKSLPMKRATVQRYTLSIWPSSVYHAREDFQNNYSASPPLPFRRQRDFGRD